MHKVLGKENILVYNCFMAMGRRNQRQRQKGLWVAAADLPQTAAHPFYRRLNELLDEHGFDDFAEQRCEQFYAAHMGRPSLTPGSYFRCLLIGYLEGIDSERGIAWRLADSISLRRFLAIELDESTPDHSTISRTRRLIDVETHREVFTWVLQLLAKQGLLKGGTIAVDATTLEASAALRSIVRRDSGESYEEFLRGLAAESGIETPSREQLAKLDKKRKGGIHLLGPATRYSIRGWPRSPDRILLAALTIPEPCRSSTIGSRRKRHVWRFCGGFGGGELPMSAMCWQRGLADEYWPPEV